MPKLKTILLTSLIFVYVGVAVLFAFSSDSLNGLAGATGNMISDLPYMPDGISSNSMFVIPAVLFVLSVVVFAVYMKSDD